VSSQLDTALLVALLFGAGVYLVLSRRFLCVLIGFVLLSNAANLIILSSSGDPSVGMPPVIREGVAGAVDPLPQALVLTAIVIGFGVLAYITLLFYRMYADRGVVTASQALDTGVSDDPSAALVCRPVPRSGGKEGRHA
jgi:multicomponent Na+:H+ antiporter subunit C